MSAIPAAELHARLREVRLLLTDVDGVMTDGSIYITEQGEVKQFGIQDGLGLAILRRHGFLVGWISARPSPVTALRAAELKIDFVVQQKGSKVAAAEQILAAAGLTWAQVCYVGDDVVDLCLLKRAGVAVAVANAIDEAKAMAHYVTQKAGGHGGVREIVTMLLKAQDKWDGIIRDYTE